MKKTMMGFVGAGAIMMLVASGCSSKPSAEELQQLESLKAEVSSLQREVSSLESEKAALNRALAGKNAQLNQCEQDTKVVQERLKGM